MARNPFLNTLQALGLYGNAAPAPTNIDGIPPEMMSMARSQALTGVGGQLLAAGFSRDPRARAEALAGMSEAGDMSRPLYNMAQARLMSMPKERETRTATEEVDGRILLIDMETGETIQDLGAAPARGNSGVTVNNMMPGDKKYSEVQATLAAEREGTLIAGANEASAKLGKLNAIQAVNSIMEGGSFAEYKGQTVAMLKSLGADDEFIADFTGLNPRLPEQQQIMQKMVAELVVGSIGPGGFPAQNFSNADREFLEKMFPQINGQPWANDLVIEALKRTEQFKIRRAEDWDLYAAEAEAAGQTPSYRLWERDFRKRIAEEEANGQTLFGDLQAKIEERYAARNAGGGGTPASGNPANRRQSVIDMYVTPPGAAR